MRHKVAGVKLGRTTSHKIAMFRNLVTSLIKHDRIETTLPKAKELRSWADKMVTLAKKNTVHARREAMKVLRDRDALQKLFSTLVDRYKDRKGGYTRIMKLGFRHGDNAAMAVIEYLTAEDKKVAHKPEGGKAHAHKAAHAPKHASKPKAAVTHSRKAPAKTHAMKTAKKGASGKMRASKKSEK